MSKKSKFIGDDEDAEALVITKAEDVDEDAEAEEEDPDAETSEEEFLKWAEEQDALDEEAAKQRRRRDEEPDDEEGEDERTDSIVERDGKFVVMSEDGDREFGTYDTEDEAKARLAQVERLKREDEEDEEDDEDGETEEEFLAWVEEMEKEDEEERQDSVYSFVRRYSRSRVDSLSRRDVSLRAIALCGVDLTRMDDDGQMLLDHSDAYLHAFAQARIDEFDPDQPRDESGRWGEGGGGGSGSEGGSSKKSGGGKGGGGKSEKVAKHPAGKEHRDAAKNAVLKARDLRVKAKANPSDAKLQAELKTAEKEAKKLRHAARKAEKAGVKPAEKPVEKKPEAKAPAKTQQKEQAMEAAAAAGDKAALEKLNPAPKSSITPSSKPSHMSEKGYAKHLSTSGAEQFRKQVDDYEHSGDTENEAEELTKLGAIVTGTQDHPPESGYDEDGDPVDDGDEGTGIVEYKLPKGINHFQFSAVQQLSYDVQDYQKPSKELKSTFHEVVSAVKAGNGKKVEELLTKAKNLSKRTDEFDPDQPRDESGKWGEGGGGGGGGSTSRNTVSEPLGTSERASNREGREGLKTTERKATKAPVRVNKRGQPVKPTAVPLPDGEIDDPDEFVKDFTSKAREAFGDPDAEVINEQLPSSAQRKEAEAFSKRMEEAGDDQDQIERIREEATLRAEEANGEDEYGFAAALYEAVGEEELADEMRGGMSEIWSVRSHGVDYEAMVGSDDDELTFHPKD